ncbi:hypothetical protein BDW02DRAFT_42044 [Decorospora gaudefroyi]|uniref:Uncharacterized protein n=1 Tax=Decorospora gaudefroyi TaxID=184978 RepID=A0A6A5K1W5_9PLEO|nr:hypothetical protein BDW02DRAFT_42044 [Decorospora gaudefroyi]
MASTGEETHNLPAIPAARHDSNDGNASELHDLVRGRGISAPKKWRDRRLRVPGVDVEEPVMHKDKKRVISPAYCDSGCKPGALQDQSYWQRSSTVSAEHCDDGEVRTGASGVPEDVKACCCRGRRRFRRASMTSSDTNSGNWTKRYSLRS